MDSCIFEAEEAASGERLEKNAAVLRDKINEAMNCWSKKMEKEKFLECRNEILGVLKKYEAKGWESAGILASALNEDLSADGHQARVIIHPLLVYHEAENRI